jgi:membrane protein implicated in regulation of membrane protease activity
MNLRNRKIRLAIVLAIAVVAAVVAWRTSQAEKSQPPCEPGRHEEKDTGGKVIKVTRTTCL